MQMGEEINAKTKPFLPLPLLSYLPCHCLRVAFPSAFALLLPLQACCFFFVFAYCFLLFVIFFPANRFFFSASRSTTPDFIVVF